MKFVAYKYDPQLHGFHGRYPANRPSSAVPNKMSGGKPPLRRIRTDLETMVNRVPTVVTGDNEHAIRAWNVGRDAVQRVDAYISWSLRCTFDRIGALEDGANSFMRLYAANGPVCLRKPTEPPRRGPRHARSEVHQQAYRAALRAWKVDAQAGLRLLSSLRSHVHEVRFAAECCTAAVALRHKLLSRLGVQGRSTAAARVLENVAGVCTWIAGRYAQLEALVVEGERCSTPDWNRFFHATALTQWRQDSVYKELVTAILSRRLSNAAPAAQRDYRLMVSAWNSWL